MVSMAAPTTTTNAYYGRNFRPRGRRHFPSRISICQKQNDGVDDQLNKPSDGIARREMILRSSELAVVGAVFNLSGKKPEYLGVQKNQQALALCPATKNCVSTSENVSDAIHYAPPWDYNGNRNKPVGKQVAMEELLRVIESTKPDKFTPRIAEKTDDYVHVEYRSPVLGLVDDVEFWFPPGNKSIVEYRSASRLGNFDFDYNRKRIKTLREELEKKGWASVNSL